MRNLAYICGSLTHRVKKVEDAGCWVGSTKDPVLWQVYSKQNLAVAAHWTCQRSLKVVLQPNKGGTKGNIGVLTFAENLQKQCEQDVAHITNGSTQRHVRPLQPNEHVM